MVRRVTIRTLPGLVDSRGEGVKKDAFDIGVKNITNVSVRDVYLFEGDISNEDIRRIAEELLTDFVTQDYLIDTVPNEEGRIIEVAYNHGVMDPVESSLYKAIADMCITSVTAAKTMKRYVISGDISDSEIDLIIDKLLVNKIIQHVTKPGEETFLHARPVEGIERIEVDILGLDDKRLVKLSKEMLIK